MVGRFSSTLLLGHHEDLWLVDWAAEFQIFVGHEYHYEENVDVDVKR